jgi:hypothetical protein
MSWTTSFFVGALTGAIGLVASGFIATACASWYQVSNVDLQSVAFVASITIIGGFVAFLIGLITSRVMPDPTFLKAFGSATGIVLLAGGAITGTARLLADVPPTIDGEALMLAVELRWPASQTTSPASLFHEPTLVLGSVTRMSHTQRAKSTGPLWTSDARLVDGRWVAPGAVDIFTTRGNLTLTAFLDSTTNAGFLIPLRGRPSKKDFAWTEWYPHARPGAPPLPDGFQYRYRVQKRSEPVRTETFGPFDVQTIASYFFEEGFDNKSVLATMGEFTINHRGKRVTVDAIDSDSTATGAKLDHADGVALIGGATPGLLAHFSSREGSACYVVTEVAGQLQTTYLPDCAMATGSILTTDSATFRLGERRAPRGRVNPIAFETPGQYSVGRAVVDTRRMAVHVYSEGLERFSSSPSVPPLGISPDQRSFARFGSYYDGENHPSIAVTDFVANRSYLLPVDARRMRYPNIDALDPAWLLHHFEWKKSADGVDSLVERANFVPLPYSFRLVSASGYRLEPAKQPLRDVLIDFIVKEFNGERIPVESYAYEYPVKIGNDTVNVAFSDSGPYIMLSLPNYVAPTPLLESIAKRFDAELATGKYDSLFGK